MEMLVEKSEAIALGDVTDMRSEWNSDKSKIYTKVSIRVNRNFKGSENSQTIVIKLLGGEIDGIGEIYSHEPKFALNEEVLVFAKRDKENNLRLTRGYEGKFKINTDMKTGEKIIGKSNSLNDFSSRITSIISKE